MANTIHAAVVCHKGCVRGNNEDNFFFNGDFMLLQEINEGAAIQHTFHDKCQMYGVFDGMGGGDWGERASTIAVQTLQRTYLSLGKGDPARLLSDFALKANARILEDGHAHQVTTQGTTMAVLTLCGHRCYIANVGDSRVYRLRDGKLQQLSYDHSLVGDMMRAGLLTAEQARKHPDSNIITQYLGMPEANLPAQLVYHAQEDVRPGDRFMLCSDGLCDLLSADALTRTLTAVSDPLACATRLVADALEMGGKDNTTCIIVDSVV